MSLSGCALEPDELKCEGPITHAGELKPQIPFLVVSSDGVFWLSCRDLRDLLKVGCLLRRTEETKDVKISLENTANVSVLTSRSLLIYKALLQPRPSAQPIIRKSIFAVV